MGIFNRKKKESKIGEVLSQLKLAMLDEDNISALFLCRSKEGGFSFIQGDASHIHKILTNTAKQDPTFASILKMAAAEIGHDHIDKDMPQELRDALMNKNASSIVDLPDGVKGILVDPKNIGNMSDEDIDKIINEMIQGDLDKEDED